MLAGEPDGSTDATGMASSFGKMANGSSSVITTVLSSRAARPATEDALPAAKSRAPRMG